jgi:hypothetical protein
MMLRLALSPDLDDQLLEQCLVLTRRPLRSVPRKATLPWRDYTTPKRQKRRSILRWNGCHPSTRP